MNKRELELSLRRSRLLRGMSNEAVEAVFKQGVTLSFEQGNFIIQEKQSAPGLAIILRGKVEVFLPESPESGSRIRSTKFRLAILCSGDCLGEYSLIDDNPASASALAAEPCLIFIILKDKFERLIAARDDIAKVIYRNMLELVVYRARSCIEELDRYRLLSV